MSDAKDIINTFWNKLDDSPFVMVGLPALSEHSEPMTAYFDRGLPNRLFIYLAKDNRLCQGLMSGRRDAMLQYVAKDHDFFACLKGTIELVEDNALLDKFWNDNVAEWFEGGRHDPKLTMVQVGLDEAEMWTSDMSVKGKLKLALSGNLDRDELDASHARVAMGG